RLGIPVDIAVLQADLQYAQEHCEVWSTLRCLEAFAELALDKSETDECMAYADQLLALATRGELREVMGQAHRLRGLAFLAAQAYKSARKALTQALTLAEQIGRVRLAWECHQALARVAAAVGDGRGQNEQLARAHALADQIMENLRGMGLTLNLNADQ
ncbi:MAG: hypothetical protein WCG50_11595, partial [Rhodoferax sp.]|uniref:hypothetical protein n=1 Tax=Rhodoferax sp. TaxID=50421 RepID=UPI003019E726